MTITAQILACVIHAAQLYGVPQAGIIAILETEGGETGAVTQNPNGSRDIGPMQVNSLWLDLLAGAWAVPADAAEQALRDRPCTNIAVGTWILADCIRRQDGDFWRGVGCYHAPNDPVRAGAYVARVVGKANARFGPQVFAHHALSDRTAANRAGAGRR